MFTFFAICPKSSKSKWVKQAPHSEQPTAHGMYCREILFTTHCSRSVKVLYMIYGCGATGHQSCPFSAFWPIFPIYKTPNKYLFGARPTAQGLHRRLLLVIPCGSRTSNGVPSATGVFLRLLVRVLGPPNCPNFACGKCL